MRYRHPFFIILILLLSLTSCSYIPTDAPKDNVETTLTAEEYTGELLFEGRRYTYTGQAEDITADGDRLVIKRSGVYLVSGKLTEGRIAVDCVGTVSLVLDGFEGSSSYGAVIERADGGELYLSALPDTVNILRTDARSTSASDGALPIGCVRSVGRLVIGGEGRMTLSAPSSNGAVCSDLYLFGGELSITCSEYGAWVKNSARAVGGAITFTSARIGIYSYKDTHNEGRIEILKNCRIRSLCREATFKTNGALTVASSDIEEYLQGASVSDK